MNKEYVSRNTLSVFLQKIRESFSGINHVHTKADISDYSEITVDSVLSSDSTNPVQNTTIKAEFDEVHTIIKDRSVPAYTESDNGKFLRVTSGSAAWVAIPNAEEATF